MKGDIAYSSDIIKETAKELGIPEEKVQHVLEFLIFYLKKLATSADVFAIYLPELGQIYQSIAYLKSTLILFRKKKLLSESEENRVEKISEKIEKMESLIEKGYSPHKKRSKLRNNYFSTGKSLKELESMQNGYNEKRN